MDRPPFGLKHEVRTAKPFQFGLGSVLVAIWVAASLFALMRWLVIWPTLVTMVGIILVIDHHVSRDLTRLKSTFVAVLVGVFLTAILFLLMLSAMLWQLSE